MQLLLAYTLASTLWNGVLRENRACRHPSWDSGVSVLATAILFWSDAPELSIIDAHRPLLELSYFGSILKASGPGLEAGILVKPESHIVTDALTAACLLASTAIG